MAVDYPTWGGVDFKLGLDDTHDVFSICEKVLFPDGIQQSLSDFSFPGVDGTWTQQMGWRKRTIIWRIITICRDITALSAWEDEVNAALGTAGRQMVAHGRTMDNVMLRSFAEDGNGLTPLQFPYVGFKRYVLMFQDNNPVI